MLRALPKSFWWSAGSLVPMVVGAFGPWARVADLLTIHGTDGGRDGWFVIGASVCAGLALLAYARFRRGWLLAVPLIAGLIAVATTGYDLGDISSSASDVQLLDIVVSAAWGIYVALAGSISLLLASVAIVVESRLRRSVPVESPSAV